MVVWDTIYVHERGDRVEGKKIKQVIRKSTNSICFIGVLAMGMLLSTPILILFAGAFVDSIEWQQRLKPLTDNIMDYITWRWIPDYPTTSNFTNLLFLSPEFLALFWNSIKISALILAGQLLIGVPGAWAFAVYRFKGKRFLFSLYVILMLLPFQVTMLAKYLVLNGVGLMDTQAAVILPAVFSTFPVFLIYRGFKGIPTELIEVSRIDGASEWKIFVQIGLPLAESSIMAAFVIGFFEVWNMMEEPLAFLRNRSLWPLSLYLPEIGVGQAGRACAASVITLMVSLFIFGMFKDSLEQGIVSSALKG